METHGLDAGEIAILAIALLVAAVASFVALRMPMSARKSPSGTNDTEALGRLRNQLRAANASIAELKTIIDLQQSALETIVATLESTRRAADDHASDLKAGIETIAGALDAAQAEATARDKSTAKRIDEIGNIAAEVRENANNTILTVHSLRKTVDGIEQHIAGIPELRGDIDRLRQSVAATEATPQPQTETPAKPQRQQRKTSTNGRRRGARGRKAAEEKAPAGKEAGATAEAQPTGEPETDDAGTPTSGRTTTITAPTGEPPATDTPDPRSTTPATAGDAGSAPDGQEPEGGAPSDPATGANAKPGPETPTAVGTKAPDASRTAPAYTGGPPDTAGNSAAGDAPARSGNAEEVPHTAADAPDTAKQTEAAQ
ncbi:MAG: hypothetical protein F4137_22485 [Acidobacteria bacterium]|nr:hypothetical protein [Acidobacteriota bacterium]